MLGGGKLAYVKTIRSEDVQKHFPQAPELAPGSLLYALHAADGTPIMLTDSREAAVANAWSNELETRERALSQAKRRMADQSDTERDCPSADRSAVDFLPVLSPTGCIP